MTDDELVEYYQQLLIIQYRRQERALATIEAFVRPVIADQIVTSVMDAYDVETAVGAQLDALASYRGAARNGALLGGEIFSLALYNQFDASQAWGFGDYDEADPTATWLSYSSSVPYSNLNDDQLRELLLYLCRLQSSPVSVSDIDDICAEFFGDFVYFDDNADMTMTYHKSAADPSFLFNLAQQLGQLPHPAGVEIIVETY